MRKIILSIAMLASITFVACSDSDDAPEKKCIDCSGDGITITVCDNGNGTVTMSSSGEVEDFTFPLPDGIKFENFTCENIPSI